MILKLNNIDGTYSYKDYNFTGNTVRIMAKQYEQDNKMVYSHKFRSTINNASYEITPICIQSESDFFQDMDFIFSNLKDKNLSLQSMWDCYYNLVGNHINSYGRLIDTDLEGYLDSILRAMDSISDALKMPKIIDEEGEKIRADFRNSSFQVFADYIWLNRKSNSLNPLSNMELVKYSDI